MRRSSGPRRSPRASRVNASTRAAWSAASAAWRACGWPSACHDRCQRPSAPRRFVEQELAVLDGGLEPVGASSAAAASASDASISPFHSVSTLSSSPGAGAARGPRTALPGRLDLGRPGSSPRCVQPGRGWCDPRSCRSSVNSYHSSATSASSPSDVADLAGRPHVEQALVAVAVLVGRVGVLGRVEPAGGMAQVAQHVLDRLVDDLLPAFLAEDEVGVEVDADQQRLVVEHLLEVGHQPLLVDRVAGEAAADVVVHAAAGHRVERRGDDRAARRPAGAHVGPQHQVEAHRRRELRRRAEPAPLASNDPAQLLQRLVERSVAGQIVGRLDQRGAADGVAATPRRSGARRRGRLTQTSSIAAISCRKFGFGK